MKYKDYEKAVYDWLQAKHKNDSKLTFSVRQKGSKGARLDYFIGTERSNYFGTTFWSIPVAYPGSSSDLINLMFSKSDGNLFYEFQFTQTRSPYNDQNRYALELIKGLKPKIKESFSNFKGNSPEKKQEYFRFKSPQPHYTEMADLFIDLEKDIKKLLPIVDGAIAEKKQKDSDFQGDRISAEDFDRLLRLMDRRFEKYAIPADSDNGIEEEIVVDPASNSPLNQILFGPPGTGKTYHTINKAIEIIDPSFYAEHWDNRDKLREYFNKMLIKDWDSSNGRVAFCTFHQSYTYEDFVEGIKPKFNDKEGGDVSYHIEDGVFKRMCQLAKDEQKKRAIREDRIVSLNEAEYKTATFYKLSLGDSTLADDQMIYDYCIKNSVIAIGFASDIDFTDASEAEVNEYCANDNLPKFDAQAINYFKNYLKVGNYVVISKGNKYVRALGRVTGEYKYNPPSEIRYNHFRSVEWIFTDEEIPANEIYDRNLFQMSIYKLDASGIKKDFFVSQSASKSEYSTESSPEKFVLIIDEINRGNVSSIFGELITLIEKDKRKGGDEELETTLPYSKAPFNVPDNLYILGTMNTADRSVEALDSALRRRFDFEEMPPKYDLEELEYDVFGVQVHEVLSKINQRIERLIGKDHTIGHSYFILPAAKENEEGESEELDISPEQFVVNTFYSNIIPLLQEYFFGDMAKLGLVLGKGFVTDVKPRESDSVFAEFDYPGIDDFDERKQYKIVDHRESNGTEEMEEEESNSSFKAALHILMNRKVD